MRCGVAEATGLGFVYFAVINPCVFVSPSSPTILSLAPSDGNVHSLPMQYSLNLQMAWPLPVQLIRVTYYPYRRWPQGEGGGGINIFMYWTWFNSKKSFHLLILDLFHTFSIFTPTSPYIYIYSCPNSPLGSPSHQLSPFPLFSPGMRRALLRPKKTSKKSAVFEDLSEKLSLFFLSEVKPGCGLGFFSAGKMTDSW